MKSKIHDNKKDDKAAASMSASEEITPITGIRKNEKATERVSIKMPSSSQESKDSQKEVSINYLRKMIGKEIFSFDS